SDPEFPTTEKNDRVYGKLNWQINPNHKLALGYHDDYYNLPFTVTAAYAPSTYTVDYGRNPTPQLMYTGILSDKTVLEARVSGFYGWDHSGPVDDSQPRIQPHFYDLDTGLRSGGIYYWYDDTAVQLGSSVKLSHFADDFLGGSHDFKFGVQWLKGGVKDGVSGYNDLIFTYDYTNYYGYTYKVAYGYDYRPFSYGGTTDGIGVFFDDTFRINERLTLNLGLRFDRNSASIPDLDVLDQDGNPTGATFPGRDLYDWSRFSPRLGFNYKLTKDGKTALRAHWGRYYRAVVVGEFSNSLGAEPYEILSGYYDLATNTFIDPVLSESSRNRDVSSDYKPSYTDQFIANVEREVAKDIGLSLNYVYKRGRDGVAWQDVSGQYEDATIVDDTGPDATGRPIPVQRLVSDPADSFFVLGNPRQPEMKTNIHAFTAELKKVMSNNWQARLSYTYLNSEGVLPSGRNSNTESQWSSARFSRFGQNPNDFVNAGGKLLGDRPHTVKSQIVVQLPYGFLVGANYLYQSGRSWVRIRNVTDPDLGFPSAPNIQLEERGQRRLPSWNTLDLNVEKSFSIGEKAKLRLFGYVLNVFNDDANEDVVSREVTTDGFGVPTVFIPPIRAMLGAKFTF
ncbi:MAG TPA: TonB-dependent receptor, partial [Vicinamibacteria bacterium]|nr:TonB-dependent receptor [Vicinamibacteria bacterium]